MNGAWPVLTSHTFHTRPSHGLRWLGQVWRRSPLHLRNRHAAVHGGGHNHQPLPRRLAADGSCWCPACCLTRTACCPLLLLQIELSIRITTLISPQLIMSALLLVPLLLLPLPLLLPLLPLPLLLLLLLMLLLLLAAVHPQRFEAKDGAVVNRA